MFFKLTFSQSATVINVCVFIVRFGHDEKVSRMYSNAQFLEKQSKGNHPVHTMHFYYKTNVECPKEQTMNISINRYIWYLFAFYFKHSTNHIKQHT